MESKIIRGAERQKKLMPLPPLSRARGEKHRLPPLRGLVALCGHLAPAALSGARVHSKKCCAFFFRSRFARPCTVACGTLFGAASDRRPTEQGGQAEALPCRNTARYLDAFARAGTRPFAWAYTPGITARIPRGNLEENRRQMAGVRLSAYPRHSGPPSPKGDPGGKRQKAGARSGPLDPQCP